MVRKTTEYRTSFKKGNARRLRHNWEHNSGYCLLRRHSEHIHSPLALSWDHDEWADIETTPRGVPEHVYKHVKYNELYDQHKQEQLEERLARMQLVENGREMAEARRGAGSLSPAVGTPPSTGGEKTRPRVRSCSACSLHGTRAQTKSDEIEHDKMKDVIPPRRKPTYRKPIPKPRPMSTPLGRPPKKDKRKQRMHPSPLVPYGFKDKAKETSRKRTHNIRAQAEIYPAALRAYRRRELEIEKRQEAAENAPYRVQRHKALFNDRGPPTNWDTEYRKSYVGYDEGLYRHNIQQRHDPRLAWQAYVVP